LSDQAESGVSLGDISTNYSDPTGGITPADLANTFGTVERDYREVVHVARITLEDTAYVLSATDLTEWASQSGLAALTSLTVSALPLDGVLQTLVGGVWTAVTTGQVILASDLVAGSVRFVPDANESGSDDYSTAGVGDQFSDYAKIGLTITDGTDSALVNLEMDVTPVVDGVFVSSTSVESSGSFNHDIVLSLPSVTTLDTDGSETTVLTLAGIPDGVRVSDGVHEFTATTGVNSVDVSNWNLSSLVLTPVVDYIGTYHLTLDAQTIEAATMQSVDMPQVSLTVNVLENQDLTSISDVDSAANHVYTNDEAGATIGVQLAAVDPDAHDTVTYSLTSDANGLFTINASTGVVTTTRALSTSDYGTKTVGVLATSTDGSSVSDSYSVSVTNPTYSQGQALTNSWSGNASYFGYYAFNNAGSGAGQYEQQSFTVIKGQTYSVSMHFWANWQNDKTIYFGPFPIGTEDQSVWHYQTVQIRNEFGQTVTSDNFSVYRGDQHTTNLSFTATATGTYTVYTQNTSINGPSHSSDINLDSWSIQGAVGARLTPLVLDLNGDGVKTVGIDHGVQFDLDGNNTVEQTGWVAPDDGLLVLDLNQDGLINDGRELFGSGTAMLDNGVAALDGFEALAQYDGNLDGVIDAQDDVFAQLQVWVDRNTDGQTDAGELISLEDAGVLSIDLRYETSDATNNDNLLALQGNYLGSDGQQHELVDVSFLTVTPDDSALYQQPIL
jgi:hypothetical protein